MARYEFDAKDASRSDIAVPEDDDDLPPLETGAASALERQRVTYLGTYRAAAVLLHELTALFDETVVQAHAQALAHTGAKAVVTRSPTRLVAQIGPVGLSVSWIRGGQGAPGEGELLVMEWAGDVGARARSHDAVPAVMIREYSYRPEATSQNDWLWRSDSAPLADSAHELVTHCMKSLSAALAAAGVRTDDAAGSSA